MLKAEAELRQLKRKQTEGQNESTGAREESSGIGSSSPHRSEEEDEEGVKAAAKRMREKATSSSAAFLRGEGISQVDRTDFLAKGLPVNAPLESQLSGDKSKPGPSTFEAQKVEEEENTGQEESLEVGDTPKKERLFQSFDQKYKSQALELLHILRREKEFAIEGSTVHLKGKALSIALTPLFELILVPNKVLSLSYHEADLSAFLTFLVKPGLSDFVNNNNLCKHSLFRWYFIGTV